MEEEKIILDKLSFGALAVDSRIKILKALRERRKTLSELSSELGLSPSSTKEHLEKLVEAALIEKMEEGHKWKYYELTKKGAQLVSPNQAIKVMVLLGTSIIALIFSLMLLFMPTAPAPQEAARNVPAYYAMDESAKAGMNETMVPTSGALPQENVTAPLSTVSDTMDISEILPIVIAVISLLVILVSLFWLFKNYQKK